MEADGDEYSVLNMTKSFSSNLEMNFNTCKKRIYVRCTSNIGEA